MKILGLHCSFSANNHDPSACLMINGKIVNAIEEERLNRVKTSLGYFPYRSIETILRINNLTIKDIDIVAATGIKNKFMKKKIRSCLIHAFNYSPKIKIFEHAYAHASGAYYSSGFKNALVMSIDGMGDKISTLILDGKNGKLKEIYRSKGGLHHESLGHFYACFTEFLGFTQTEGEFKVMGMSAYGKKEYNLDKFIYLTNNPFKINLNKRMTGNWPVTSTFHPVVNVDYLKKFFTPRPSSSKKFTQHHFDLALSVQKKYEEILQKIVKKFKGSHKNLCISGGCGLNCLANSKIEKDFKNIYVMPASSDRGLSLGSAYLAGVFYKEKIKRTKSMFLGKKYSNSEILKFLKLSKVKYKKCDAIKEAADDLKKGKIVGWFRGNSEFGPRALGARSILARADIKGMKKKINANIKFREKFRPFAPVMLYDFAKKYGIQKEYPYMTIATFPEKNLSKFLEEAIHEDGSTRIQTVKSKKHPLYLLLQKIQKNNLNPVLINTSFNLSGEPIVEAPKDAIRTFNSCGMDSLYIENFKIYK